MKLSRLGLAITLFIAIGSGAQSLESYLSHSGASNFASNSNGEKLAWTVNEQGRRNLYTQLGKSPAKMVTSYQQDDGQEIAEVSFSPDGQYLYFIRGGAPNVMGESPNPASLPDAPERALFRIHPGGGLPEKILNTGNYTFLGNGEKILVLRRGQLALAPTIPGANAENLFFVRGSITYFRLSPDQQQILFVSDRGDHSFIGIYNMSSRVITWIDPQINRDQLPVWSPDSKKVAFIRTPGEKVGELSNLTTGHAFSIVVTDLATMKSSEIWKCPGPFGGHAQSYPHPAFEWHPSGKILFFSEHEGWLHVWGIDPESKQLTDLTPGAGEVESYTVSPDGKSILFDTNIGDINRRHLMKTDLSTGRSEPLTTGSGIEMYPVFAGKDLYCYRSTISSHRVLTKVESDGKKFTPISGQLPVFRAENFLTPEAVTFTAADGQLIHGQLFIDRSNKSKSPGIVFMHGGPTRQMLLGFHYSDYYSNAYAFNQYLARNGYVVLSVNFRDGIGYGRDFRQAKNQGPRGAVEYQDVVAAGKYLQQLTEVEAEKIGLWGGSYGGYLTAMGLARNPELFKSGVDLHGVHDWAFRAREFWFKGGWWGITDDEMPLAYSSSPVSDLSRWTGPVLMVHGDDDRNVMFKQTTDLTERLRERNVPVELLILPDEVHGFLRYDSWKKTFERSFDFFNRTLKGK